MGQEGGEFRVAAESLLGTEPRLRKLSLPLLASARFKTVRGGKRTKDAQDRTGDALHSGFDTYTPLYYIYWCIHKDK